MYLVDFYGWNWRIPGFDENKIQHWALFSTETNQGPFYFHWAYNLEFAQTKRFAKTVGIHSVFCSFLKKFRKKIAFYLISKFRKDSLSFFAKFLHYFFVKFSHFLLSENFAFFRETDWSEISWKSENFRLFCERKKYEKSENFRETIFPIRYKP